MKNKILFFTLILILFTRGLFAMDINPVNLKWYHYPLIPVFYIGSKLAETYNKIAKESTSNPLHYFAEKENLNDADFTKIKNLIENGVNINQKDYKGNTPLLIALTHLTDESKVLYIKLVLEKGADLNLKNKINFSSLDAIRLDLRDDEYSKSNTRWITTVNLLVDYKLDINKPRLDAKTLLQVALENNNLEMAISLLEKGFVSNIQKDDETNPILFFHWNLFGNEKEVKKTINLTLKMLKLFVSKGGNLNAKDSIGSVLHSACFSQNIEAVRFLLKNGASKSINEMVHGDSPLHRTIFHMTHKDYLTIVEILLENGADISLKNENGETALDIARQNAQSGFSKEDRELAYRAVKILEAKGAK